MTNYLFFGPNDKGESVVQGVVVVEPIEGEENEADIVAYEPDEFEQYVNEKVVGMGFGALDDCPGSEGGFNKYRLDHWEALGEGMRHNGYSGVVALTDEQFDAFLEERGLKEVG